MTACQIRVRFESKIAYFYTKPRIYATYIGTEKPHEYRKKPLIVMISGFVCWSKRRESNPSKISNKCRIYGVFICSCQISCQISELYSRNSPA